MGGFGKLRNEFCAIRVNGPILFRQSENVGFGNGDGERLRDAFRGRNLQFSCACSQSGSGSEKNRAGHHGRAADNQHSAAPVFVAAFVGLGKWPRFEKRGRDGFHNGLLGGNGNVRFGGNHFVGFFHRGGEVEQTQRHFAMPPFIPVKLVKRHGAVDDLGFFVNGEYLFLGHALHQIAEAQDNDLMGDQKHALAPVLARERV